MSEYHLTKRKRKRVQKGEGIINPVIRRGGQKLGTNPQEMCFENHHKKDEE